MEQTYKHIARLETELKKYPSQAQLARGIGVAPGRLSQYLSGKFVGDLEKFEKTIDAYFKRQTERESMVMQEILHLKITDRICTVLEIGQNRKELVRIVGPNGIGKTMAVDHYLNEHPAAIKVTANESYRSVKAFLSLVMGSVRRKEFKGTGAALFEMVVKRLRGFDTIIIIDQAHKLSDDAIGIVQAIHDATGVPFAFIGTEDMNPRLNKNGELVSRLTVNRHLQLQPAAADVEAICKQFQIVDKSIVALMKKKSEYGGLRIVSRILDKARDLAPDGIIDLESVHESLGITEYNEPTGV